MSATENAETMRTWELLNDAPRRTYAVDAHGVLWQKGHAHWVCTGDERDPFTSWELAQRGPLRFPYASAPGKRQL